MDAKALGAGRRPPVAADEPVGAPTEIGNSSVMAAGKSMIGELLADQFPKSAHVRGDVFRRMVSGREDMTSAPPQEAWRQLRLRYRLGAMAATAISTLGSASFSKTPWTRVAGKQGCLVKRPRRPAERFGVQGR
ncbi:MAG: hypothetical protein ACRDYA_05455 [Egibacteraceae bacterium]